MDASDLHSSLPAENANLFKDKDDSFTTKTVGTIRVPDGRICSVSLSESDHTSALSRDRIDSSSYTKNNKGELHPEALNKHQVVIEQSSLARKQQLKTKRSATEKLHPERGFLTGKPLTIIDDYHQSPMQTLDQARQLLNKNSPNNREPNAENISSAYLNYEQSAQLFLDANDSTKTFKVRKEAANKIRFDDTHPLYQLSHIPLAQQGSTYLDRMGAGAINMGTVSIATKEFEDERKVDQLTFDLNSPARNELQKTLQSIKKLPQNLENNLPDSLAGVTGITLREVDDGYDQFNAETGKFVSRQGDAPVTMERSRYQEAQGQSLLGEGENPTIIKERAKAIEINFQGVGRVVIGNDPDWDVFSHRIIAEVDSNQPREEGLRQLQGMLMMLGLGEAVCPSRNEDVARLETALLFHEVMQGQACHMESEKDFYTMDAAQLKHAIITKYPEMKEAYAKYFDGPDKLFHKEEIYSGRLGYVLSDRASQIREAGGVGLYTDITTRSFNEALSNVVLILKSGQEASAVRGAKGKIGTGMSVTEDHRMGGAKKVFLRMVATSDMERVNKSPQKFHMRLLYDLDTVNVAGSRCHATDFFGAGRKGFTDPDEVHYDTYQQRPTLMQLADGLNAPEKLAPYRKIGEKGRGNLNEVLIEGKIAPKRAVGLIVIARQGQSINDVKEEVYQRFEDSGLIQNGMVQLPDSNHPIPLEDFFHFQVSGNTTFESHYFPQSVAQKELSSTTRSSLNSKTLATAKSLADTLAKSHSLSSEEFVNFNSKSDKFRQDAQWENSFNEAVKEMSHQELLNVASRTPYELRGYDRMILLNLMSACIMELGERQALSGDKLNQLNRNLASLNTRILEVPPKDYKYIGGGAVNSVYLTPYGVFKPDPSEVGFVTEITETLAGTAVSSGIPAGPAGHLSARAVCSSAVDIFMHGENDNLSVKTEYVIINGKRGILMENAKASSEETDRPILEGMRKAVIDRERHVELDMVVSMLFDSKEELTPRDKVFVAMMTKTRNVSAKKIDGKWQFRCEVPKFKNFDPDNATTAEKLLDAQILDIVCGQVDRHQGNYYTRPDGSVILIDNDTSFGVNSLPEDVDVRAQPALLGFIPNNSSLMLRFPTVLTEAQKERIDRLHSQKEELKELLAPYISPAEIDATFSRIDRLHEHTNNAAFIVGGKEELLSMDTKLRVDSNNSYWARELLIYDSNQRGQNYQRQHRAA